MTEDEIDGVREEEIDLIEIIDEALNTPGMLDKLLRMTELRHQHALDLFDDGEADCRTCEVNCHTFWFPEQPGGRCGYWGLPMKDKTAYAELLDIEDDPEFSV